MQFRYHFGGEGASLEPPSTVLILAIARASAAISGASGKTLAHYGRTVDDD
jgi:hypothetical protein